MDDLVRLSELIKRRNQTAKDISAILGRPALIGHVGEFIASRLFAISLAESATQKGIDGYFREGPLEGRSVDVKCYGRQEGSLDINPDALPNYYLVLTGPRSQAVKSQGEDRPWVIESIYLFDANKLVVGLRQRGLKIGVATSIRQQLWREAEIFPTQRNRSLVLSDEQRQLITLFKG